MTTRKRKTAPATRSAPSASSDPGAPATRTCEDCVPALWVQGGAWGWAAHRHALHGEGENPGPMPGAEDKGPPPDWQPWNEQQRAEFHRRHWDGVRRARSKPPAPSSPRPPRHTG